MFKLSFNSSAPAVIVFLFFIAILFVIFVAYKKLFLAKKGILPLLHSLCAFLLLCAIFQPEISLSIKTKPRKPILVLIDTSKSMKAKDRTGISKIDKALSFLTKNKYIKRFKPVYYSFGSELTSVHHNEIEKLKPEQDATKIGTSISKALEKHSGNCSGVVVISDGYENQFVSWEELKNKLTVPVYTIGVGDETAKDIGISTVITNSPLYEGETLKISVVISQNGFDGEKIAVSLKENRNLIQGKTIELTSAFNRIDFEIPSLSAGDYFYEVSVQHAIGETNSENNTYNFLVRSILPVIHILYVEGSLRWEYKFLKRFLESDKKYEPVCLVRVGESTFQQTGGKVIDIPSNILGNEKFLQNFNIIIFGDIDFSSFSESELENLKKFVEKNKSILFIGGENFLKGLNRGQIKDILPITLTGNENSFIYGTIKIVPGENSKNFQTFENIPSLPYLDRINVIENVKESGCVVFESTEYKNSPVVITTSSPGGKSVVVGTDSTWKWYYGAQQSEKDAYEKFWGSLIRFLCSVENYLEIGESVPEILMDKHLYAKGETVQIKFIKKQNNPFTAYIIGPDRSHSELKISDNIASFVPDKEGVYIVCAEFEKKTNKKEFTVTKAGSETENPGKDTVFLKKLSEISGGTYLDLENADKLKKLLGLQKETLKKNIAVTDETEKYLIPLIFALLCICWFLRRRSNIL